MYHDEMHHLGRPHFHARYGDDEASIDIEDLAVIAGRIPPRALRLVVEWASAPSKSYARTGSARAAMSRCRRSTRCARRSTIEAMRTTPLLIDATPTGGFAVCVVFDDGTAGEVDLSYLVDYGGVFKPLSDPAYFRQLRADPEAGTIVWPNDADIAPETLYAHTRDQAAATA